VPRGVGQKEQGGIVTAERSPGHLLLLLGAPAAKRRRVELAQLGGIAPLRIGPIDAGISFSESRRPAFMHPAESSLSRTRINSGDFAQIDLAAGAFLIGCAALKRCGVVNPGGTVRGQRYGPACRISELLSRTGLAVTCEAGPEPRLTYPIAQRPAAGDLERRTLLAREPGGANGQAGPGIRTPTHIENAIARVPPNGSHPEGGPPRNRLCNTDS